MIVINHPHEIILTETQIKDRIIELGKQITSDYEKNDLVLIGILKGASVFFADLIRSIYLPITIDFIKVSSYKGQISSSGKVNIIKDCTAAIEGNDVLLIEDIVDTGATSKFLMETMMLKKANSVKICTLLNKSIARPGEDNLKIDYSGFDVPDRFLVGYGLDYMEKYRNLPYIAAFL